MNTASRTKLFSFLVSFFTTLVMMLLAMVSLVSCGYKPVSYHTNRIITEPLYLDVKISKKYPENAVSLKDEAYKMLSLRLGAKVTRDRTAPSRLSVSYNNISYTPLSYDSNGYVSRYRANVSTLFKLKTSKGTITRNIRTTQEADVNPSAIESSRAKKDAINECSKKALDQFVAYVASKSMQ